MASKEPSKELREFYNIRLAALQVTLNTPELLTERIMQGKTIAQLRVENIYRILKEIDSKKRVISPNELKVLEKSFNSFFTHPNLEKVTKANYVNREFVNTVWKIEGGSRAFQQQLTRHRTLAFSIQSLRIVNVDKFADNGEYSKSDVIKSNPEAEKLYDETMVELQERYKKLIKIGCPIEDARGILPLNIQSPITFAANLRALYASMELRFCGNTQKEFRDLAKQIKEEIRTKLGEEFAKPMVPVCFKTKSCPSPFPCEKYKQFPRTCKMDVSRWLRG